MSEWKMDGAEVLNVLTGTETAYNALLGIVTEQRLGEIFGGLTWGAGVTACVSQAVDSVLSEQQSVNLRGIVNHVGAGIAGVGNAGTALNGGNEEMASTFQSEMFATAQSGDFTYFDEHGYGQG
ncbi:MAG: DUF6507 family protein [Ruaniaceae bacterium]|nr:DUF6507 family protein [Ruaniaceae bacterium]